MELLLELLLTVCLSFMFTFLFTRLISMNSTADDLVNDHSEMKSGAKYLIQKAAIDEHYFGVRSTTCDEVVDEEVEQEEIIIVERLPLLGEPIKLDECAVEGKGSLEFLLFNSSYISEAKVTDEDNCKEIVLVELDVSATSSGNVGESGTGTHRRDLDGEESVDSGGSSCSSSSRFCQIEIELLEHEFSQVRKIAQGDDDESVGLDDWEEIERGDFEEDEVISNSKRSEIGIGNPEL